MGGIKKLFKTDKLHIEPRKGKQADAINYSKKDGKFHECGRQMRQGERGDLDEIRQLALDEGMRGVTAIANMQGINVATKYLTYNEPARDFKPEVIWIWGESGSGKSREAREICGTDIYTKNTPTKWWDGYDAHENVIIDDFRGSWWTLTEMLSLLDRYERQLEVKGGMRQMRAKRIVITSIVHPRMIYGNAGDEPIEQLLRRVDEIRWKNMGGVEKSNKQEVTGVILHPSALL